MALGRSKVIALRIAIGDRRVFSLSTATPLSLGIIGATSFQGRAIVREAVALGHRVSMLSRPGSTAAPPGGEVRVVRGYLHEPSKIIEVFEGCDQVIYTPPTTYNPDVAVTWLSIMMAAAEHCGVRRFILNSSLRPPKRPCGVAIVDSKLAAERRFAESTIEAVITRPTIYLSNLLLPHVASGIVGPEHTIRFPLREDIKCQWTSVRDAAQMIMQVVAAKRICVDHIECVGSETISVGELARQVGEGLGCELTYERVGEDEFCAELEPFLGGKVAAAFADLYRWLNGEGSGSLAPEECENTAILRATPKVAQWAATRQWSTTAPNWISQFPMHQQR